jgi:hypothetical protein
MSSLSYDSILEALATLSFSDKLRLNEELATALRKEGKSGAVGKAIKKEKKVKDPSAKPRKTAPGTLAWIAFVKHCKTAYPERFTECVKEPERLTVAKGIRAEDEAAYKEFCEKFKEEHAASAAGSDEDGSDSEAEVSPAPAPKEADRSAALEAIRAKMAAKTPAPKAPAAGGGGAAAKPTLAAGAAAKEAKKEEKKPAPAAKEPKAKKEVKKAKAAKEAPKEAEEEQPTMEKKEIDGVEYFFDPELNGLWMVEDGQLGAWVGKFQPGNEEEPIRFTDSPGDE